VPYNSCARRRSMPVKWARRSIHTVILVSLALVLARSSQGQTSDQIQSHVERAEQAIRANDLISAEREYRQIVTLDPQDIRGWTGLGILLYGKGRAEEAEQALNRAIQIDPGESRARLFLGLSEADLRHCDQAMPILDKYFGTEPVGRLQRLAGLAIVGCAIPGADPLPALQTIERMKQAYPGDPDVLYAAAELYTRLWNESAGELITSHPESYRVHELAGEVYEAKNDYDQAIREYLLALERNPRLPQMHYRIGQLYLHQDSEEVDEKAMNEFRQEKAIDPNSAVTDLAMAGIEVHRHNLEQAQSLYEEALKVDPTLVEAGVGRAKILLEQKKPDLAVQQLAAVIKSHPNDPQAHYALMLAYRQQEKLPEAAAEMEAFSRLQAQQSATFQNKLDALLNGKSSPKQ